jgi:hypothetical protein
LAWWCRSRCSSVHTQRSGQFTWHVKILHCDTMEIKLFSK